MRISGNFPGPEQRPDGDRHASLGGGHAHNVAFREALSRRKFPRRFRAFPVEKERPANKEPAFLNFDGA